MPSSWKFPTLVLHGGKDYFNSDSDVRGFVARIPENVSSTYHDYPEAYHLLMYDEEKDRIFRDVERWLNKQRIAFKAGCRPTASSLRLEI